MEQRCQVVLFSSAGKKCFGPGPAELLERVERSGSLHQAAKQMYLSYSKAFKLIRAAEEGLGFPLMETRIGGARGGGSILTPEARRALAQYRAYEAAARHGLGDRTRFATLNLFEVDVDWLRGLGFFDRMLIDPPREGAHAVSQALSQLTPEERPRRIVCADKKRK